MARYRRRRRSPWARPSVLTVAALAVGAGAWWMSPFADPLTDGVELLIGGAPPSLTSSRPEFDTTNGARPGVTEKGAAPNAATPEGASPVGQRAASLTVAGRQALERGELIAARTYLSDALQAGLEEPEQALVRAELTRLGNETIFSSRILADDPLTERYIIQSGDSLGKIAKANKVSVDLLASINGIANVNRIRAGQTIKIIHGPFHAVLDKSVYVLDVYMGSTFAKHFKVGLGADDSTPTGKWQVAVKLENPTYYPPRGGRIIAADDPKNPLGERWIGLQGISGEAVGQMRYGIHGTIEPQSIGQSVSMGCVRMYNEDVTSLYIYLVEEHSTVTVHD